MFLAYLALFLVLGATGRWMWLTYRVRMPETPTLFVATWGGGAVLGVVALLLGKGGGPAITAVALGSMLVFLASTSAQKLGTKPIAVGDLLMDFEALDENGEPFQFSSLFGKPILLKFFRGHW